MSALLKDVQQGFQAAHGGVEHRFRCRIKCFESSKLIQEILYPESGFCGSVGEFLAHICAALPSTVKIMEIGAHDAHTTTAASFPHHKLKPVETIPPPERPSLCVCLSVL